MRFALLLVCLPLLVTGCAPATPVATSPAASDVRVDGVSILGAWDAVGAPDQADVDSDLRAGQLTRMLVFNPYGRVTLTGEDRRQGTGRVTFEGRITNNRIAFQDLPGQATVRIRTGGTLEMTDPNGNRTIYRRRR